ncbi:hypothetical protein Taro_032472 [Colocasia esculenta]|uniref:Uncharacterized protein n=1 Tax=Colocasia esculenta TaxID=4460 RepID=A0A843VRG3_COLES|nr:hypothetical protein [Colocasia esculenta]
MAPQRKEGGRDEAPQAEDDKEDGEEGPCGGGGAHLPTRKRFLLPSRSRAPCGLDSSPEEEKKTRYLPSLRSCHGCGRRFPYKGSRERLHPLDSQWRVVLLCKACHRDVRSAQVCSYCFSGLAGREGNSVGCRRCSCRVHVRCVPEQRGYRVPSDLDPGSFTCVDCCAFPVFGIRKLGRFRESPENGISDLSAGNAVGDAKAAGVENVVTEKIPAPSAAFPDEELALQFHRSTNESQKISRNLCAVHPDQLIDKKKELCDANLLDEEPDSGNFSVCGDLELSAEVPISEAMEIMDAQSLNVIGACEGNFTVNLDRQQEKYQRKQVTLYREGDATVMPASEEALRFDKFLNSTGDKTRSNAVPASCSHPGGPNTTASQQEDENIVPDRFMKKYFDAPHLFLLHNSACSSMYKWVKCDVTNDLKRKQVSTMSGLTENNRCDTNCHPKQDAQLDLSARSFVWTVPSEVGEAFLVDPATSLKQQNPGRIFRLRDFGFQSGGFPQFRRSEKLASTSLDAGISVGVHRWTLTPPRRHAIDANLAFGQNLQKGGFYPLLRASDLCFQADVGVQIQGSWNTNLCKCAWHGT